LFFRLNTILAKLVKGQGYDIKLTETHHIHKKDAPSGTAITLAEGIQKGNEEVLGWTLLPEKKANHVPIESIREGEIPGTHTITYSSPIDSIEITHTAHGRQGFAQGAVIAGEWIQGKKGTFGMDDLLNFEI
ncbi:MAG: dihydrodipicolinate reductase C-terminal domain-containing protein, partial [Spirosomataceae bacterium]